MFVNAFWFGFLMCIVSEIVLIVIVALINGVNGDKEGKKKDGEEKE